MKGYIMIKKKNSTSNKPRVLIGFNTGTKVIRSKKDKQNSRQHLKLELRNIDKE